MDVKYVRNAVFVPSAYISFLTLVQPEKAFSPIEVTELGMVTLVMPVQPLKAEPPIEVTELGMVMLVKPEQS